MLSSRRFRYALGGVGLLLLLTVVWVGYQVWQVNRDLNAAVDHAAAFQDAVAAGDGAAIDHELKALQDAGAAAEERTSGPTWSVLTRLPVFGDDARGIRVVSQVVDGLATDGLEPLVAVQDQLGDLLPQDGAVPLETVASLEEPVARAEQAMNDAEADLATEDPSGFTGRLKEKYRDLQENVGNASDAMTSARVAVDVLPAMLGQDGERDYLLVFQNNAEIRATGGLPGAVSLLHADDGRVEIARQATGGSFDRAETLPLPLTEAETTLYDDVVGAYFLSSNMTPDVPRAADLWAARWQQVYPEDEIDGVLLVDTVALSYVLDATGPITVDGIELTSDNLVDELLHGAYLRLEDPKDQDAFFAQVATTAFDQFTSGAGDATGLVRALARGAGEGRVNVHSFDDAVQEQLAGTAVAGELVTDADDEAPQVNVTINDTTGAKMSYFLRYDVDVRATYCTDDVQGFSAKARLTSDAPADAAELPEYITGGGEFGTEPGVQLVTVRIYGPAGGSVDDLTLNAKPLEPISVDQDGRPVAMFYIELKPGQTVDLSWTMESGTGQIADPDVRITPSIVAGKPTPISGAC